MNALPSKLQDALDWLKEAALSDQPITKARVASRVKLLRDAIVALLPVTEEQALEASCSAATEQQQSAAWENAIANSCTDPDHYWMSRKFIQNMREHKRKHPAFMPERVAEFFIHETNPKTRAWYCYQPISYFTKLIHKSNSFSRLCSSQS